MTGSYTKFVGHAIALFVLSWLTYIALTEKWVPFLDSVNLIFHEAGHWIFFWGPEWFTVLGGTLGQILIPVICAIAFWRERKLFETQLMVWWVGQNLVNISVYMADARTQALPLLGGGGVGHDWTYLLREWGLLMYDKTIAAWVAAIGTGLMVYMLIELALHLWALVSHRFHR